jgi:hypothetical protein
LVAQFASDFFAIASANLASRGSHVNVSRRSLLLVTLVIEALVKAFSSYIQAALPGGITVAVSIYLIFDFAVVAAVFALPDIRTRWNDV